MRFCHILANHNKSSNRCQSIVLYTHGHVQGIKEMSEVTSCVLIHGHVQVRKYPRHITCIYSQSRATKINELTCNVCNSILVHPWQFERGRSLWEEGSVKAPPMVGPTWTRVHLTLGSDCLPTLSQGTTLLLPHVSWTAYCLHACDSMIWVIQGCISTSHLSMSPWGLFITSYSVCLHGALYPMTDYYVYSWWRALRPASAEALWVS